MSPDPSGIRRGFIVEAGGAVNSIIPIPTTVSTVGRDPSADLCLPYEGVSRQHLRIDGTGPAVFVADAQSTNGTWINDRREAGWTQLSDGDHVKLGTVRLRFFDVASTALAGIPPTDAFQVTQPQPGDAADDRHNLSQDRNRVGRDQQNVAGDQVNIGRDQHNIAGDQHNVGRDQQNVAHQRNDRRDQHNVAHGGTQYNASGDQIWKQKVKISADYEPTDEIFNGEGPGRVIAILGALVALGGFAWFMAHIFQLVPVDGDGSSPPPTIGYAFATFALGGILLAIGTGMSKARRKRNGR
jgi:pSer/pThr/pTyr-binding forkhead associated (FHA) protein